MFLSIPTFEQAIPQAVMEPLPIDPAPFDDPEPAGEAPAAKPAPGFWESLLWCAVYVVFAMLSPLCVLAVWSLVTTGGKELFQQYLLHAMLVGDGCGVALSVFLLRWRVGRAWISVVNLRRPKLVPAVLALLCLPAVMLVAGQATSLLSDALNVEEPSRQFVLDCVGSNPYWFCVLVIAVGAGVNEELFCRGFLGRGLVGRYGMPIGVLLTSLLFAVLHMSVAQGFFAFLVGLYLHAAYLATRSLWVPMALHFLVNACSVTLLFMVPDLDPALIQSLVAIAVTLAVAVPSAYALWRLRERQVASPDPVFCTIETRP